MEDDENLSVKDRISRLQSVSQSHPSASVSASSHSPPGNLHARHRTASHAPSSGSTSPSTSPTRPQHLLNSTHSTGLRDIPSPTSLGAAPAMSTGVGGNAESSNLLKLLAKDEARLSSASSSSIPTSETTTAPSPTPSGAETKAGGNNLQKLLERDQAQLQLHAPTSTQPLTASTSPPSISPFGLHKRAPSASSSPLPSPPSLSGTGTANSGMNLQKLLERDQQSLSSATPTSITQHRSSSSNASAGGVNASLQKLLESDRARLEGGVKETEKQEDKKPIRTSSPIPKTTPAATTKPLVPPRLSNSKPTALSLSPARPTTSASPSSPSTPTHHSSSLVDALSSSIVIVPPTPNASSHTTLRPRPPPPKLPTRSVSTPSAPSPSISKPQTQTSQRTSPTASRPISPNTSTTNNGGVGTSTTPNNVQPPPLPARKATASSLSSLSLHSNSSQSSLQPQTPPALPKRPGTGTATSNNRGWDRRPDFVQQISSSLPEPE
ncbi:hypothetical protein BT69DRAFT_367346 [Atractiella rhizophila]|nr:hypothetical protein BT69DRAFT_367346 [Atractiella rhizophila]